MLCGGRLRLGVGIGWNEVEYEALGEDFPTAGARIEEQIALLRALWTEPVVDFTAAGTGSPDAGINPLPVQRPIPVWLGGQADAALRRAGRLGRRLVPQRPPDERARGMLDRLRETPTVPGGPRT